MKSILLWIIIIMQIWISYYVIDKNNERTITALIVGNVFFSTITIPGLILHFNHLIKTRNTILSLRYSSISIRTNQESITLKSSEVIKIILHDGPKKWKVPWWNYSWYEFIDIKGDTIKISCYLLEINELWFSNLSRQINTKNIERTWSFLPIIK